LGIRYDNWKVTFIEQRCKGTMAVWGEPFTPMRIPKIYNLRTDPYEFADVTSNTYWDWYINHVYIVYGAIALLTKFNATFDESPRSRSPTPSPPTKRSKS
jgi:arylsulfatase